MNNQPYNDNDLNNQDSLITEKNLDDIKSIFIDSLYEMGFYVPSYALHDFFDFITEKYGYTPLPSDEKWEEVLNLAADILVDDPDMSDDDDI